MTMCWCCKRPLNSRQTLCISGLGEKRQFPHLLLSWCYWDRKKHETKTINKIQTKVKIFTWNTVRLVYFYLWTERVADSLGLLGVICSFLLWRGFPRAAGMEKHLWLMARTLELNLFPFCRAGMYLHFPHRTPGFKTPVLPASLSCGHNSLNNLLI